MALTNHLWEFFYCSQACSVLVWDLMTSALALMLGTALLCHGQQTSSGIWMLAPVLSSHSFIGNAVL